MSQSSGKKIKAICLLSGGLDSIVAAKLIQEQQVAVTGLSFVTPFFGPRLAEKVAADLNIELIVKDITMPQFALVKNPPHGYGKTMNPCIDCHGLMFNVAGKMMEEQGFDFIFTGEVLDERPMSQNRRSLDVVANISGYKDYILRPLSAKLLEPTYPELSGLVDREKLLAIRGRSRKPQIELAEKFGLKEYPNPAGGCLLTDKGFSQKLKELLSFQPEPSERDLRILTLGRHLRISTQAKLIVGRNKTDNQHLQEFCRPEDVLLRMEKIPGPTCLLMGVADEATISEAARVCAAYSDAQDQDNQSVIARSGANVARFAVTVDKTKRDKYRIN